jgi:uncharacterized protein
MAPIHLLLTLTIICYMVKFECDWCGKCCMSFGEFIKIERQVDERNYFVRYDITNEHFPVHVMPEFADEIDAEYEAMMDGEPTEPRKRCIFSRKNPDGTGFACAVYPTRPTICRDFHCYRMLIHHMSGELRGKVIGFNELKTHDETLAQIWAEKVAPLPHPISFSRQATHRQPTPVHTAVHAPVPAAAVNGHDSKLLAVLDGLDPDDGEWIHTVITILAAHGYHGDPVEL